MKNKTWLIASLNVACSLICATAVNGSPDEFISDRFGNGIPCGGAAIYLALTAVAPENPPGYYEILAELKGRRVESKDSMLGIVEVLEHHSVTVKAYRCKSEEELFKLGNHFIVHLEKLGPEQQAVGHFCYVHAGAGKLVVYDPANSSEPVEAKKIDNFSGYVLLILPKK